MRVMSFNVNGIRARLHQLKHVTETWQPEVIGLQETKVVDGEFPLDDVRALGYEVNFHGQKGHYGVALLSKRTPTTVNAGYPWDVEDAQRRFIAATYDMDGSPVTVVNGYFPQGESRNHPTKFPNKARFYADLYQWLNQNFTPRDRIIVMGDMNVSHQDIDIGIGEDNRKRWLREGKCSFLPEEREWLDKLCHWGLKDTYRVKYPQVSDRFSWFDYRSRGFERDPRRGLRIDLILATAPLADAVQDTGIDYDTRAMEKPSDHCPIWTDFIL